MAPEATLWHLEISHYNEKARWAFDYKGVPYELKTALPGAHRLTALRVTRGKHDRLPVAEIDGRRIGDSTAIIAALEEAHPEPALYPADAAERGSALELEDYFDEELAPRVRRFVWQHTLDDADATVAAIATNAGPTRRRILKSTLPLARPVVRRDYDVSGEAAREAVDGMRAAMDRIESELGGGDYLVGDAFSVADLTACALFTPLIRPPGRPYLPLSSPPGVAELREELEARPGGEWIHGIYSRHRGTSAAVAA